jgi:hypothetical protein
MSQRLRNNSSRKKKDKEKKITKVVAQYISQERYELSD